MSTQINLDVLKSFKVDLYNAVVESLSLGPITGIIQVSKLQWFGFPEAVRNRLVEFLRLQAPNPEHEKYCGCDDCFQKRLVEQQRSEAARLEVEKQNVPGQARLNEYMTRLNDQGQVLLNNDFNKDVFWKFLDEKFPGLTVVTPRHVDVFVAAKRLELQFGVPPVPVAPTPTPVQPEPVLLSARNC